MLDRCKFSDDVLAILESKLKLSMNLGTGVDFTAANLLHIFVHSRRMHSVQGSLYERVWSNERAGYYG